MKLRTPGKFGHTFANVEIQMRRLKQGRYLYLPGVQNFMTLTYSQGILYYHSYLRMSSENQELAVRHENTQTSLGVSLVCPHEESCGP